MTEIHIFERATFPYDRISEQDPRYGQTVIGLAAEVFYFAQRVDRVSIILHPNGLVEISTPGFTMPQETIEQINNHRTACNLYVYTN